MKDVLVVDDEMVLAKRICGYLSKRGIDAGYAATGREGVEAYQRASPQLVLLDFRLGDENGLDVLREIRTINPGANVVMMTGHGDISIAVDAMKAGARDFLTKPAPLSVIADIASNFGAGVEIGGTSSSPILGRSAAIEAVRREIAQNLQMITSAGAMRPPVMILGETGTGKELAARMLHCQGLRPGSPFIALNCAALPAHLVEAELFGHEAGAFTGAGSARVGLFEAADGGVLFLDEVGELPTEIQSKLLRVLEDGIVRRLGSTHDRSVDVWVISATNRSVADMVRDGSFRQDLLFRLQVLWFEMPPLRERDSDILFLARRFLNEFSEKYSKPVPELADDVRAALLEYDWPGNVRELRNVVERAVVRNIGGMWSMQDIGLADSRQQETPAKLRDLERSALTSALDQTGGNVTRAAELLGVSRDTLRYRIQKHGLN